MTGKSLEQESERFEEVSRMKEVLERESGGEFTCGDEESVRNHEGEELGRSPETINAFRAREPRAESHDSVDTINAYRSKEPRPGSSGWSPSDTDEEVRDDDGEEGRGLEEESFSARIRNGV